MLNTYHVKLQIGERVLLDDLNWQVDAGQFWCVIGRNGAGKSTLLRTLAGLRAIDAGSVAIKGRNLADWPLDALARMRAYLPQSRSDAFSYRVIDAVLTARHPYQTDRYWENRDDHQVAYAALQAMDITGLAERDLRTLSGGERQRAAIAALLAQDTPLLLLDEPANALDLAHQVSVMGLLTRLCLDQNKAAVMVSHDLNLARSAATHALLLMGDGKWQAGTVEDVMQAPLLSRCLGHPIETIQHGKRTIFIPIEETP